MKEINLDELHAIAMKAAENAYAPYSSFRVGAALLAEDGDIIRGCNVENRSYGVGICAERTAVTKAVSEGKKRFLAIAVATPDSSYPVSPCGACRQVLSEFMPEEAPVRFGGGSGGNVSTTIGELFPHDALRELKEK